MNGLSLGIHFCRGYMSCSEFGGFLLTFCHCLLNLSELISIQIVCVSVCERYASLADRHKLKEEKKSQTN